MFSVGTAGFVTALPMIPGGSFQPKSKPLAEYLAALRPFAAEAVGDREEKLRLLDELTAALSTVRFELLPAYACEDYELIGPRMDRAAFLWQGYDELLVVGQRIQPGGLSMITKTGNPGAKCIVVSNLSSIRELLAGGTAKAFLLPQDKDKKYIHAKIFLLKRDDRWDLFCGSMNLTAFSVSRNLEFMVRLKNPAFVQTAEGFLSAFLGIPEQELRQQLCPEESAALAGSPVFRSAASIPVRACVISRILNRKNLSPADGDRITAYAFSPACQEDLVRLLHGSGLSSVPERRKAEYNGRERDVYLLPLRERVLLALLNQALHRYDGCFSRISIPISGGGSRSSRCHRSGSIRISGSSICFGQTSGISARVWTPASSLLP